MKIIIDTDTFTLYPSEKVDGELPLETISNELRKIDQECIDNLCRMLKKCADPDSVVYTIQDLVRFW